MRNFALAFVSAMVLTACNSGGESSSSKTFTTTEKVENRPTVPVFSPWGKSENPDPNYVCRDGNLWMDCSSEETPYSMVWINRSSHGMGTEDYKTDVANLGSGISPEETAHFTSHPTNLYLVSPMWNYWFDEYNILDENVSYYMDEVFKPHENSIWGHTYNINYLDQNLQDSLVEKALNIKADGGDGILFDWWHDGADGRGDTDPDNLFTREQTQQARIDISRSIREAVGSEFIIMGNTNWYVNDPTAQYLSGVFLELWKDDEFSYPTYKEDGPYSIEEMESVIEYWDENLSGLKVIAFEPWNVGGYDQRLSDENIKLASLFTAMAIVVPENGYILYPDPHVHTHEYYDVFSTDLGKPIGGRIEVKEGVSYKEFEKGYAIFNRTDSVMTFDLNGENVTIESKSGKFIVN